MKNGLDQRVIDAFIFVPPVATVAWLLLLSGRFNELAAAILWPMFFFAIRPLIWHWAASRDNVSPERAEAYRERERNATNTSFLVTALIGLTAYDVLPLPGNPYWTDQPRASFAMVPIVVYMFWLAMHGDIPAEVRGGYRRLFGRKEGS